VLLWPGFEDATIEAMADDVRCGGYTGQTGPNHSNLGAHEVCMRRRWCRRKYEVQDILQDLVEEEDWVCDGVLEEFIIWPMMVIDIFDGPVGNPRAVE
jgi:hypothetical protein